MKKTLKDLSLLILLAALTTGPGLAQDSSDDEEDDKDEAFPPLLEVLERDTPRIEKQATIRTPSQIERFLQQRPPVDLPSLDDMPSIDGAVERFVVPLGQEKISPVGTYRGDAAGMLFDEVEQIGDERAPSTEEDNAFQERELPPKKGGDLPLDNDVDRFLFSDHIHGGELSEARAIAKAGYNRAVQVLNERDLVRYHRNAAVVVGLSGNAQAETVLLNYIRAPMAADPSIAFSGKAAAIISLGYLAYITDGAQGLELLLGLTEPEAWNGLDLPWRAPSDTDSNTELAIYALAALAVSGSDPGLERLQEVLALGQGALNKRLLVADDIEDFISQNRNVARNGLL